MSLWSKEFKCKWYLVNKPINRHFVHKIKSMTKLTLLYRFPPTTTNLWLFPSPNHLVAASPPPPNPSTLLPYLHISSSCQVFHKAAKPLSGCVHFVDKSYSHHPYRFQFVDFCCCLPTDEEFSPEDLFNMFFGGGFPQGNVARHRRQNRPRQDNNSREEVRFSTLPSWFWGCVTISHLTRAWN